jgi:cytochrome c peroxidase
LKTVPSTRDLVDLLANPTAVPAPRVPFPGMQPLPPLDVHPLEQNPLTLQPLLLELPPFGISFRIPAIGSSPFVAGAPDRALERPLTEDDFVVDPVAAARLGKALFWDMQVGSDGVQACASCHFHAGADDRTRNQLNPGTNAGDGTLQVRGKNQTLAASDFPFHRLFDPRAQGEPLLNPGNVARDSNDVASSMGVRFRQFVDIPAPGGSAFISGTSPRILRPDLGTTLSDPVGVAFQGVRRVEPRNTPTVIGAARNFDNFWDGRARHDFNGGSPFGAADPQAHVFVDTPGGLQATRQLIRFSSLASQATGPALSDFEMSFRGRTWAKIGKKLLQAGVVPLANQLVSPADSVLGPLANQNAQPGRPGLNVSYRSLIEQAFGARFWSNSSHHLVAIPNPADGFDGVSLSIAAGSARPAVTGEYTQAEANFSLFFGLAVQAYQRLLDPNDSPFDRFHDANPLEFLGFVTDIDPATPGVQVVGLTTRQLLGYDLFQGSNLSRLNPNLKNGQCSVCHFGAELSEHTTGSIHGVMIPDRITGADRVASGFMLEFFLRGPAKFALELDGLDQTLDGNGAARGIGLVDKGVYNIGVRPSGEDVGRGGDDPFGFPLSLSALSLRNAGFPVGVFSDPANPVTPLPATLAPFANPFPIGLAFPNINRTVFLPDSISPTSDIFVLPSGTYPNPNRVARRGSFKVPQLRNVELTGPYFHNGGALTLRQVVDFYARGGDFPVTNAADRDPLIVDLRANFDAQFSDADALALVDFLLALTDPRVKFERAPFDHPELIVPVDGATPDNSAGRNALLADARFRRVPATGAAGRTTALENFLGVASVASPLGLDHFDSVTDFAPPTTLLLATPIPGRGGVPNAFSIGGATPGALVGLYAANAPGAAVLALGNCGGIQTGLAAPRLVARGNADASGLLTFTLTPAVGQTLLLQAVEPSTCRASNLVSGNF